MTLLRHSLIYAAARGVPGALNFLALAVFSHLLTPVEYGRYALVIAIAGLLNSVLFEWLHLGLLRFLPTAPQERRAFLRTIVSGYLMVVAATGVLGALSLLILSAELRPLVGLALALTWGQVWFELTLELLRAQLRPVTFGVLSLARALLSLGAGVFLVRWGLDATGRLLGMLLGATLPALLWSAREWRGALSLRPDPPTMQALVRYGLPLTVTFAFGFILSTSDRLLLGWLRGPADAGIFAVGMDLAQQSLGMLMAIVNLAAYPLAVRAMNDHGPDAARAQLTHNGSMLLALAVPAAAGLAVLAPQIAQVALGPDFRDAATRLIPWMALSALLMGLKAFHLDLSFQLGQHTVRQVWVVLVAAGVNVALNLLLIPAYGYMGCAYASVVAAGVALGLSWWWGRRAFAVPVRLPNLTAVLGGTLALLGAELLLSGGHGPLTLLLQIGVGAVVYLGVYVALSSPDRARLRQWLAQAAKPVQEAK